MEIIVNDRILPECSNSITRQILVWMGLASKIDPLVYNEVTKTVFISSDARRQYTDLQIVLEVKRRYKL